MILTITNVEVADIPGALVFHPDGRLEYIPNPTRDRVLQAIEPRGEDWGILEMGHLPGCGRPCYWSRFAESFGSENPLLTNWLGRPIYGTVVVVDEDLEEVE